MKQHSFTFPEISSDQVEDVFTLAKVLEGFYENGKAIFLINKGGYESTRQIIQYKLYSELHWLHRFLQDDEQDYSEKPEVEQ